MNTKVSLEMKFKGEAKPSKITLEHEITTDGSPMVTVAIDDHIVAFIHESGNMSMSGKVI